MPGRICIEMARCACGTNMVNVFADEEEKRVSGSRRQSRRPPISGVQAFRCNRKERYSQKRSGRQTDQRTKRLVLQTE